MIVTLVIVLILFVIGLIVFISYKTKKPNEVLFSKYKSNYFINSKLILRTELRFNTIKFLEDIKSIQIVEEETPYTIRRTNKNFLIFSTYSKNRKEVHKLHEIFVCNELLEEVFSADVYNSLLNREECNCKIKFRDE